MGVHIPAAIDTRAIRKTLKLTQQQFCHPLSNSGGDASRLEQGRRMPDPRRPVH